ncbi:hypothetical protein MRX96_033614 [Rhipicephalus microplus]
MLAAMETMTAGIIYARLQNHHRRNWWRSMDSMGTVQIWNPTRNIQAKATSRKQCRRLATQDRQVSPPPMNLEMSKHKVGFL